MMAENNETRARRRKLLAELENEFASVRVSLDVSGNGPRLLVEDAEGEGSIFLSPLELASLCLASPEDREQWIRVGAYRGSRDALVGRLRTVPDGAGS